MGLLRRQLLVGGTAAALGACGQESVGASTPKSSGRAPEFDSPAQPGAVTPTPLSGRVLGFGVAGAKVAAQFSRPAGAPASVLADVDLGTGTVRHTPYEIVEGHEPLLVDDSTLVCVSDGGERILFIDPSTHALRDELRSAPNMEYSGHARIVDGALLATVRERGRGKMAGRLEVIDLATRTRVRDVATGGHVPHEVVVLEDRDEIAISHYGHFGGGHFTREPYYWDIEEPAVSFLDRTTLRVKRRFVYERPLALTHMRLGADGLLYVVSAQYVRNNAAGLQALATGFGDRGGPTFVPAPIEREAGRIGVPGPVVVVDPVRGIIDELMPEPLHHRKQQSVGVHRGTGHVIVTFTYSDQVMRIEPGSRAVEYWSAAELGIDAPCGVVEVAGTPYVAISGRDRGLAIVDVARGVVRQTYDPPMFSNVHLSFIHA